MTTQTRSDIDLSAWRLGWESLSGGSPEPSLDRQRVTALRGRASRVLLRRYVDKVDVNPVGAFTSTPQRNQPRPDEASLTSAYPQVNA